MKKPFALFDLEGLSFTVNEKSEGFPYETVFYPYLIYKIVEIDKSPSIFIIIDNGLTHLKLPLRRFIILVSPVLNSVWRITKKNERTRESPLVSTLSEPKNEQLLLFRK